MSNHVVLCVDDEAYILRSLERLLRKETYRVVTADGGATGLAVLEKERVQLILSDQRMPRMTGVEFLQKAKEIRPEAIRVILSGYADVGVVVDSINKGEVYRFLTKPWNDEELKRIIMQCLRHYEIVEQNRALEEKVRTGNRDTQRSGGRDEEVLGECIWSFELSPRLLEKLPLPVIGVSRDGTIVATNRQARELFEAEGKTITGRSLQEAAPTRIAAAATHWLARETSSEPLFLEWGENALPACRASVASDPWPKGCLLLVAVRKRRL